MITRAGKKWAEITPWSVTLTGHGLQRSSPHPADWDRVEKTSRQVYRGQRPSSVVAKAMKSFEQAWPEIELHEIDIRILNLREV